MALPDAVRRWQPGWGLAAGYGPAVESDGALHVPIGKPGRRRESFTLDADSVPGTVARLAHDVAVAETDDWLTVITRSPQSHTPVMRDAGLELAVEPEYLMAVSLRGQPGRAPAETYTVSSVERGPLIEARVTDAACVVVARGLMAVTGADAIAHDIHTDPAHRRRGLAAVVMATLAAEAVTRGATTGLLIASPAGRQLYESLGWTVLATVLSGHKPPAGDP
jgi:GNAT superfamily N-acetyltransferase